MMILMIVDNHDDDDDFVHQGHGHIQFSLVPSTVAAGLAVDVFLNTDCIPSNTIDVFLITESSKPPQTGLHNRVFQNAQKSKDLRGRLAKYVVIHN